ncbi:MAG: hypothetical protein K6L76_06840 [Agarilytica sp.]
MNILGLLARTFVEHPLVQRVYAHFNLSSPKNQQALTAIFLIVMFLLLFLTAAWNSAVAVFSDREVAAPVSYVSFEMYDAELLCQHEMEGRLGDALLRHHVDEHSSRLDKVKGIFRMYFKAEIGDLYQYDVVDVHCFVDKWDKDLAYYREFNPNLKSIKSSDLKFFN